MKESTRNECQLAGCPVISTLVAMAVVVVLPPVAFGERASTG
jgi:hypothetical protein